MLKDYESEIDNQIYQIYGISDEDRGVIETETSKGLSTIKANKSVKQIDCDRYCLDEFITLEELSVYWISFSVGVAFSKYQPGIKGELGCAQYHQQDFAIGSLQAPNEVEFDELVGPPKQFAYIDENGGRHMFHAEIEQTLRDIAIPDGIAVLDEGHPRDLPTLVEKALVLMLGETDAREVIREATGDPSSASLRKFLERNFFTKWHMKMYKSRPVYWPIQSSNRNYGFVIFHEKISRDTFFAIQRAPYLDTKRRAVQYQLEEIETKLHTAQGRDRKVLEKQLDQVRKLADELTEFAQDLERITLGSDGLPGYTPQENWIDDGVILRMAPLWEVIPTWKSEPKRFWGRLLNGDYDWSHIAMHYWPERCKQKCKTNKSFAIAHELEHLYEGN